MESSSTRYKFLQRGYEILQCFCVSFISLPLIVPIFGSLFIVRQIVNTFMFYRHNGRFQLLHPVDAIVSINSRGSARIMICLLVRSENAQFNLDKFRKKFYDNPEFRFGHYKKLQYRLCIKFGFLCWEDMSIGGQFDINEHIKLFPGVGNKPLTKSKLMSLLTKCANSKATITTSQRPEWEILLIPQVRLKKEYNSQNNTVAALILNINHGYMDAISALEFLKTCVLDNEEHIRLPRDYMIEHGNRPKSISTKLNLICRLFLYGPMYVYRSVFCNSESVYLSPNNPSASEGTLLLARSNYSMTSTTMNKIRLAFGINSRTVIYSAYLAALRITAEQRMIKPPNSLKIAYTHSKASSKQPENRFALIVKCLPLVELSPRFLTEIESLIKVNADTEYEVEAAFWLAFLVGLQPAKLLCLSRERIVSFTTGVTGAAASETLYRIQGGLVEAIIGIPPVFDGLENGCSYHNYGGTFNFSFGFKTNNLMKDSTQLDDVVAEFDRGLQTLERKAHNMLNAKRLQPVENDTGKI